MKVTLIALALALSAACACAQEAQTINQLSAGGYFVTQDRPNFDPNTGWAVSYLRLTPRNWYFGAEVARYNATISFTPPAPGAPGSAEVKVTTWGLTLGRAVRSGDGGSYLGLGIGLLVDDDIDLGQGVRFESDLPFGWEVIAGTTRAPVGLQVRYRDGGMPANTGITAALGYAW